MLVISERSNSRHFCGFFLQVVQRFHEILQGVFVDSQLIKELPAYHGEVGTGYPLLKAVVGEGVVDSYFPLHNDGAVLSIWRSKNWELFKPPIEEIREYFGDREAFYFSWLSHYTTLMLVPAVIGFAIWAWAYFSELKIDDNPAAPLFGIFVAIWATIYLKLWTRQSSMHSWGNICQPSHAFQCILQCAFLDASALTPCSSFADFACRVGQLPLRTHREGQTRVPRRVALVASHGPARAVLQPSPAPQVRPQP